MFALILLSCAEVPETYRKMEGMAFGTTFHLTYLDPHALVSERQVDSLIHAVNRSLSTYLPNSDISRINRGDTSVVVDALFEEVFRKSEQIYSETGGAFDPTIGILVNAWGFGPGDGLDGLTGKQVDSLMDFVGFDQLRLEKGKLLKQHPETFLDFNANAKGYGADVIGRFFESRGVFDYLVEIGGEIRARGRNAEGETWKIAIEKPNFDGTRSFQTVIALDNESIATSGNYRKFKVDPATGKKFAHTIDTGNGYPSQSDLLSASVIAGLDCADVDGYATALMAMGLERSKQFLETRSHLKAFLIFSDEKGDLQTYQTPNLVTLP